MNITALKSAMKSENFRLRVHAALLRTAKLKKEQAFIKNRKGKATIKVVYNRLTGFSFFTMTDKNITDIFLTQLRAV